MLRYPPLSAENYIRNRADFAQAMQPGGMALFSSNDVYPTSADGSLPFRQDSNKGTTMQCSTREPRCRVRLSRVTRTHAQ